MAHSRQILYNEGADSCHRLGVGSVNPAFRPSRATTTVGNGLRDLSLRILPPANTPPGPVLRVFGQTVRYWSISITLLASARRKGFDVGYDALGEDSHIHFSTPPGADQTTTSMNGSTNNAKTKTAATDRKLPEAAYPLPGTRRVRDQFSQECNPPKERRSVARPPGCAWFLMNLRRKQPPDSLYMLLDTMCNAFGGIILLAVLVTLLTSKERGTDAVTSAEQSRDA